MVCVVRSCCATSPYREVCRTKGGIRSGETLRHDIYPARPITTVSLATNTYCRMDSHSSCAPRTVSPRFNVAVCVNRAIDDRPGIQQEVICYQWFKQRLILSISEPSIRPSQRSQIKEDIVEPSVPVREFILKAYAAVTWHNDRVVLFGSVWKMQFGLDIIVVYYLGKCWVVKLQQILQHCYYIEWTVHTRLRYCT